LSGRAAAAHSRKQRRTTRRRHMTAQEAGLDGDFRRQVLDTMTVVLARLLDRAEPVTEDMRLMEELGLSSTFGLELLLEVEDQLMILIDVESMDADQMKTVGDLATFVAGHSRPG
jgi:acyl carrier protein